MSFLFFWCSTGALGSTLLGAGFLYCILSASSLDPNSSGPQAPSAWCGFPYHISSPTGCYSTRCRTQLSNIIVRRPLDLWNRMFDCHQAEITVKQFRGHSLPVHQSMSVPWEFFSSSHFISQFPPMRFPLITAIRMCHFLPVHQLGMAFLAGFECQNTTERPELCFGTKRHLSKISLSLYFCFCFCLCLSLLLSIYLSIY